MHKPQARDQIRNFSFYQRKKHNWHKPQTNSNVRFLILRELNFANMNCAKICMAWTSTVPNIDAKQKLHFGLYPFLCRSPGSQTGSPNEQQLDFISYLFLTLQKSYIISCGQVLTVFQSKGTQQWGGLSSWVVAYISKDESCIIDHMVFNLYFYLKWKNGLVATKKEWNCCLSLF